MCNLNPTSPPAQADRRSLPHGVAAEQHARAPWQHRLSGVSFCRTLVANGFSLSVPSDSDASRPSGDLVGRMSRQNSEDDAIWDHRWDPNMVDVHVVGNAHDRGSRAALSGHCVTKRLA